MHPVATAIGDAALLFDIELDQLTRPLPLVAHDLAGGTVQLAKPRHLLAGQDRLHGGVGLPERPADPMGTHPMGRPIRQDRLLAVS